MKKKTLLILLSALLVCGMMTGCGSKEEDAAPVATDISKTEEKEETPEVEEEEPEVVPEVVPEGMYRSELTNEIISEEIKDQRPIAVMVDNEIDALDHHGLTRADIVYEMMNSTTNGEITRFMALFKDWKNVDQIGCIRSVRPTNFMIAPEYNAVVIHDGGPFYIDAYLKNPWVYNLSGGFWYDKTLNRKSWHTEFVTTGEVESRLKARGYSEEYNEYYQGPHWLFSDPSAPTDLAKASDSKACTFVDLPFPHNDSELEYDTASNTYLYSEYGRPNIDLGNNNKQLAFTNVVLQCADHHQYDANGYMQFNIINTTGEGYYITGGQAIPVTWKKGHDMDPTKFYDAAGNEIVLNTGKTYIGLVSSTRWNELVLK